MIRLYAYRALDGGAGLVEGRMAAADRADLATRLAARQRTLLACRAVDRRFERRPARKRIAGFTRQFEQLVRAGVPAAEALQDLAGATSEGRFGAVLADMIEAVEGGASISAAFARHPDVFGPVYAPLVRLGERSGQLPSVLLRLADLLDRQDRLRRQIRAVMIYPATLAAVLLLVVSVLLGYLAPQLRAFMLTEGESPPPHTRALLLASDLWLQGWPALLLGALALPLLYLALRRGWPPFARAVDRARFRLWLVGPLLLRIRLAQFAHAFALAYSAGLGVLEAIELSAGTVESRSIQDALAGVGRRLAQGQGLSDSFAGAGLFPPLVVRMIAIGERSGQLEHALQNVDRFFERDVEAAGERLAPLLAPVMILALAALVAWIVLAVLGPIYQSVIDLGAGL